MRILILKQIYPPEPGKLGPELAQTLQEMGNDVTVLTGFPNYPTGKLYPGYRLRPWMKETLEGIPVVRVPLFPDHSRSGVRRALNYLTFALSATLLPPFLMRRPDVIFVYHPPLTIGLPAWVLSRWWRAPFLYSIADMWPETLEATGMVTNASVLNGVGKFAKWIYGRAAAIRVISPGFREDLINKGVPPEKITVIPNWVDTALYAPEPPDSVWAEDIGLAGKFNVMFAGNIGEAQGLEAVLAAAQMLSDVPELQFVLVGDGVALPRLREQARNIPNVRFLGRYPAESMSKLYALADVLLVHLKDEPLFRITIPHKIMTYMATGKPILAAVSGDAANAVTEVDAGIACPPENPELLAHTVRTFMAMSATERRSMGECALVAAHERYNCKSLVGQIEALMRSLISNRKLAQKDS